jgi:hypothetical protein
MWPSAMAVAARRGGNGDGEDRERERERERTRGEITETIPSTVTLKFVEHNFNF